MPKTPKKPSTGRLTQERIDTLLPQAGRQYVAWDKTLPGFGVRVSPAGAKSFILKYRLPSGRVRWKTLGRVGSDLSLDGARGRAQSDRGKVADGIDPLRAHDEAKGALSLATVAERFLTDHVEARRAPSTLRLYNLAINSHIRPVLGSIPIGEIGATDAARLHHRLRGTPYLGNRVLAVLSKLLAWAVQVGYRPAGPNPCAGIEKFREAKRKRYLNAAEYAQVGKALRDARKAGTIASASLTAIELLLVTGCRPQEIASLQWDHVDLKRRLLDLPTSKTGAKVVHLSPDAVRILQKWPRWAGSSYVFPGTGRRVKGDHIHATTLAHVWADLREAAGITDCRLYDACRHSYASTAVSTHGLSLAQVGEQLGHSQPATTARYAHLHDSVARQNAAAIGGSIAKALKRRAR